MAKDVLCIYLVKRQSSHIKLSGSFVYLLVQSLRLIWDFADLMNGLMAIPNIVAVLLLSRIVVEETKKYAGKHIDDVDAAEVEVLKNADKGVIG